MRKVTKYLVVAGAWFSVLYPLWVVGSATEWAMDSSFLVNLFPLFGLLAFSLLWLHAISGVFEPWLRKNFNFDSFVDATARLILVSIILHPLLFLIVLKFHVADLWRTGIYIRLAIIGWLLLIIYDIAKPLKKKYDFFVRHWNTILLISTFGFLLTFFHSIGIGDDVQQGPLHIVWLFYGVTAIIATTYTYGIKRFLRE
jgi:hypothetical protein